MAERTRTAATKVGSGIREGSAEKRAAILRAARELLLADGFERTSVDAIAADAGVSKRTVYDYYGDKRTLLLAVVQQAMGSLVIAVHRAIDENLTDVGDDLEGSLIAFAQEITETAIGSSDYTALIRLVSMESTNLPELRENWDGEPEDLLGERFVEFERRGLLVVPRPRLAADHFVALVLSSTADSIGMPVGTYADAQDMITEGVRAFLRAYGTPAVRQRSGLPDAEGARTLRAMTISGNGEATPAGPPRDKPDDQADPSDQADQADPSSDNPPDSDRDTNATVEEDIEQATSSEGSPG